ncbi:hypothetical protein [Streptomyces luteolus]|uniref:Uncharacterized protein n=1 Tax=Streptomyces luteolus TaxID=3043615 RepID=A0ABT6TAV6_9ACTN|nr:hypothetical protein [Streptomyces sp. B-S-A12]MDI3424017.1 hypothetical protein [Streptomyces sp. B-S-A12]
MTRTSTAARRLTLLAATGLITLTSPAALAAPNPGKPAAARAFDSSKKPSPQKS